MSSAPPPSYARLPLRYFHSNLRPIVLAVTAFSALWTLAAGIGFIKARADPANVAPLPKLFLAFGIVYLFVSALEMYGFVAAYSRRPQLIKIFLLTTFASAVLSSVTELARVIVHFVDKNQIIATCVADQLAENNGSGSDLTPLQASSYCSATWQNGIYYRIGFLILTALLASFFTSLVASYLHQINHPSQTQGQAQQPQRLPPSAAYNYPLAPYPGSQQTPAYDVAPPYIPNSDFKHTGEENGGGYRGEKEGGTNVYQNEAMFGESTETVRLEPRMGNEGRV